MANLHDLALATIRIAREDTDPGGLVPLTDGKTKPIVRYGQPGWEDPPVVALFVVNAPRFGGVPEGFEAQVLYQILVPIESDGLQSDIADRMKVRLTQPAYQQKGLDTTVQERSRQDATELARGMYRLDVRYLYGLSA